MNIYAFSSVLSFFTFSHIHVLKRKSIVIVQKIDFDILCFPWVQKSGFYKKKCLYVGMNECTDSLFIIYIPRYLSFIIIIYIPRGDFGSPAVHEGSLDLDFR